MLSNLIAILLLLQVPSGLAASGVVTGYLRSSAGAAAAGIRVAAFPVPSENVAANRSLAAAAVTTSGPDGRFRLVGLSAGRYYLMAGRDSAPTYYPGVFSRAAAQILNVASGNPVDADFALVGPQGVRVRGELVRSPDQPGTGRPATVQLQSAFGSAQETATVTDGRFEFLNIVPGDYILQPQAPEIGSLSIHVGDGPVDGLRLMVQRTVDLETRVSVQGGGPVPRFGISITGPAGTRSVSQAARNGRPSAAFPEGDHFLAITGLPPGYFVRSVSDGERDLLRDKIHVSVTDPKPILITLGTSEPPPWFSIRGRVIGTAAAVTATGPLGDVAAAVRPDGTFEFSNLLPGRYGLRPAAGTLGLSATPVDLTDRDVEGLEVHAPPRVALRGRVRANGPALPMGSILFKSERGQIALPLTPAADGSFSMTVAAGEYRVEPVGFSDSYRLESMTWGPVNLFSSLMQVDNGTTNELVLTFNLAPPAADSRTAAAFRVAGRVAGAENQPGRQVALTSAGLRALLAPVAPDGTFVFPSVPPGTYTASLQPRATGDTFASVRVADRDVTGVELAVPKLLTIRGQIVVDGGGPLPAFPLRLVGPAGSFNYSGRDQNGNFTIAVPPGDYKLTTSFTPAAGPTVTSLPAAYTVRSIRYGSEFASDQVFRVTPENREVLIVNLSTTSFRVRGRVAGSLTAQAGRVVALRLSVERTSGLPQFSVPIAADGTFEVLQVPPGRYSASVEGTISRFEPQNFVVIDRDLANVELRPNP